MPGISVHVVDVSRGTPTRGMRVDVLRLDADGARTRVGGGTVGDGGLLDDPALGRGDAVGPGIYQVELAAGDWFRAQGTSLGSPAFQETVVFRFGHADPAAHVHLPIKLSPWGVSVWRGA